MGVHHKRTPTEDPGDDWLWIIMTQLCEAKFPFINQISWWVEVYTLLEHSIREVLGMFYIKHPWHFLNIQGEPST